ncbi:MAG: sigma 54-interacting transcriptional regulator [Pseudomonadota bacterium]
MFSSKQLPLRGLMQLPEAFRNLASEQDLVRRYEQGDVIVGPGKWSDDIRYLVTGKATIVLRDDHEEKIPVDTLVPGDIFGEVSLFTGSPWPSDSVLVADEQCLVIEIPCEDFGQILSTGPEVVKSLVKNLVRRTIRLDRSVLQVKLKKRSLQSLISREDHVFPDYHMGKYVRQRVARRMEEMAQTDNPVLITGETGVGKEGLALTLFRASHLCKEVFLAMDLHSEGSANIENGLQDKPLFTEEERTDRQLRLLFGSEEPARDGGRKETPGYFDMAEDGTLLVRRLDQLTRLSQLKLLEAVETGAFRRVGGVRQKKAKVRLMATTRLNPEEVLPERHPLIHALRAGAIAIPPLRSRRREIPPLIRHYLDKHAGELRRGVERLPKETLRALLNHQWPGNDLELSNTLKRAVLVSRDGVIKPDDVYFDLKRVEGKGKINLLRLGPLKRALVSPLYPGLLQFLATPFFFIILAFLFFGPTDPMKNPAALVAWAVGWPFMVIASFLLARFWCSVCPIGVVGNLAKRVAALELPFPAFLRNHSDFLIAGAVLAIIWFETATGIRNSPVNLGFLLLAMLISAVIVSMVFERQSWCQYLCGLGGMVGVLAKTSVVELRADRNVCISHCTTNECYLGTETDAGCPFGQAGPRLHSNRLCKLCAQCLKNCPHDAIRLSLRLPGREIWEERQPKPGTAFLVTGMIGGLLSEMVSKTITYKHIIAFLPLPEIISFSLVFAGVLIGVNLLHGLAATVSKRVCGDKFAENYARFGLALLPLALTAFMSFHVYYMVNLGALLPGVIGQGLDLAALQRVSFKVSPDTTMLVQQLLLWAGLGWSLLLMYRIGLASTAKAAKAALGALPHAVEAVTLTLLLLMSIQSFFNI